MPMEWSSIIITCWAGQQKLGRVASPYGMSGAIRRNSPGDWTFSVDDDDERIEDLVRDDARVTIDYRPEASRSAVRLLSGPLSDPTSVGDYGNKGRTFTVIDDWDGLFNQVTGWPNPTGGDADQGTDSAYFSKTGPASQVAHDIAWPNLVRLGIDDLYNWPTTALGSNISVKIRMHSLAERLFPAVDTAGVMIRVLQDDAGIIQVIATVPPTRTQVLTESSGVVAVPEWSRVTPAKTRYVVGAGGEGTARYFKTFSKPDWESQYGFIREGFIDARDIEVGATDRDAQLKARADEQFEEDGPKVSLKALLAETEDWAFAETFFLGDVVRVLPEGLARDDYLEQYVSEVQFSVDDESGLCEVSPLVGDWSDTADDDLAKIVRQLERAVRDQQRSF